MKIIILGGFLGSGKTTVLLQLSKYLVQYYNSSKASSVVIIENEISSSDVDGLLLSNEKLTVENIFSGCICCSSSGQLPITVNKIKQLYSPDCIIIEATGLARPDSIKAALSKDLEMDSQIITIVDSVRWPTLLLVFKDFVESQLRDASLVLVNKIDQIDEQQHQEVVESASAFNTNARLFSISAINEISETIWETLF